MLSVPLPLLTTPSKSIVKMKHEEWRKRIAFDQVISWITLTASWPRFSSYLFV
jgi:hypothetical protein